MQGRLNAIRKVKSTIRVQKREESIPEGTQERYLTYASERDSGGTWMVKQRLLVFVQVMISGVVKSSPKLALCSSESLLEIPSPPLPVLSALLP